MATIFMVALISVAVAAAWQRGSAHEVSSRCPHQKLAGSHALKELCTSLLAANAAAGVSPTASLFVDVGAAYASESLLAHAFGHPVLALECRKEEYDTLLRTRPPRGFAGLSNITLRHSCASDTVGLAMLYRAGDSSSVVKSAVVGGARGEKALKERHKTERVRLETLDNITSVEALRHLGVDRVGFIKIDTQGAEEAILRGASATVVRDRPSILYEDTFTPYGPRRGGGLAAHATGTHFRCNCPSTSEHDQEPRDGKSTWGNCFCLPST